MWRLTKKDMSILLGNVLDHFDIALFGFFAPLLGPETNVQSELQRVDIVI